MHSAIEVISTEGRAQGLNIETDTKTEIRIRMVHHYSLDKSETIKMEAATQEPVGKDPLSHRVDEVEALAREKPPGVAAVDAPVDVKQEKSQAEGHLIEASLICGPEFHANTDVCHEAHLLGLPKHPEIVRWIHLFYGYYCTYVHSILKKISLIITTLVCRRSRPRCPAPEVPIDSKSGVSAAPLGDEGRRLGARPSRGADPASVP